MRNIYELNNLLNTLRAKLDKFEGSGIKIQNREGVRHSIHTFSVLSRICMSIIKELTCYYNYSTTFHDYL